VAWAAKLDPLGQCAARVQPAGHTPGDPAAGAAPWQGNGAVLQPASVLRSGSVALY